MACDVDLLFTSTFDAFKQVDDICSGAIGVALSSERLMIVEEVIVVFLDILWQHLQPAIVHPAEEP